MVQLLEVTPVSLAYLLLGGFVVLFSVVSLLIKEKLYIGEVVLGTVFGVIIGPYVANIFDPRSWSSSTDTITLEVMRVVLATGLFAIGVELPKSYLAKHIKSLLIMVIPTMAIGWVISAGIIKALFPNLNFISTLVISACLTPTDPILAAAIIGGKFAVKNVPGHIRRLLSAESAANDGLAYPFLSIAIYLTTESSTRVAVEKGFLIGWFYQVMLGSVFGAAIGIIFSHVMRYTHEKGFIDRESYVAQYLAISIFTIGAASTLGLDDLLATFAAGSAISWDGHFNQRTENELFSSVIDLVLNCGSFIYIGAWLPFNKFNDSELGIVPWKLVVLFIALLFLRRIPVLLLLYKIVPDIENWREALFCGHFGPMGVGAVFISTLGLSRLPIPHDPPANQAELLASTMQPIVAFVVLGSILIHGLSIPAFWFGRKIHARTLSVSRSTTWSRTWTGRNQDNVPDWVLSAHRVSDAQDDLTPTRTAVDSEVERVTVQGVREVDHKYRREADIAHRAPEGVMDDSREDRDDITSRKEAKSPAHSTLGKDRDLASAGRSGRSTPTLGSAGKGEGAQTIRTAFLTQISHDLDDNPPEGARTPKQVQFAQ